MTVKHDGVMQPALRAAWASMLLSFLSIAACGGGQVGGSGIPAGDDASTSEAGAGDSGTTTAEDASTDGASTSPTTPDAPSDSAPAEAAPDCGIWKGVTNFTCAADGNSRGKCVGGAPVVEACARGCYRNPTGEDTCLGAAGSWPWTCTGTYGTTKSTDGDYYLTSFGCWTDAAGAVHLDTGDNCIPTCLDKAIAKGLCPAGSTGPQCEEKIDWFTADGARFGCLARLRIENPKTGKAVVAVALDYGPACSVEASVGFPALDASGRVDQYLFGGDMGISDKALVHVVEVDPSTPLGPVP